MQPHALSLFCPGKRSRGLIIIMKHLSAIQRRANASNLSALFAMNKADRAPRSLPRGIANATMQMSIYLFDDGRFYSCYPLRFSLARELRRSRARKHG